MDKRYKVIDINDTTFAVVRDDDKVIISQEDWRGKENKEILISKQKFLKLADKIKDTAFDI